MPTPETLATVFRIGGQVVSQLIKMAPKQVSPPPPPPTPDYISQEIEPAPQEAAPPLELVEKDTGGESEVKAGCVPCATGHLSTTTGLLDESMRFARTEGIASDEVIDRMAKSLKELNAMERVDLSPEKIAWLPAWEKEIAEKALELSRATRHAIEGTRSVDDLEKAAADISTGYQEITRLYFGHRLREENNAGKAEVGRAPAG